MCGESAYARSLPGALEAARQLLQAGRGAGWINSTWRGGGLQPVGGGGLSCRGEAPPTSAGAWRENGTLHSAGGPRLSGALWVNYGPVEMGAWARGPALPGAASRSSLARGSEAAEGKFRTLLFFNSAFLRNIQPSSCGELGSSLS